MKKKIITYLLVMCLVIPNVSLLATADEKSTEAPLQENCICETLCTEGTVQGSCAVCSKEGADLAAVCKGAAVEETSTDENSDSNSGMDAADTSAENTQQNDTSVAADETKDEEVAAIAETQASIENANLEVDGVSYAVKFDSEEGTAEILKVNSVSVESVVVPSEVTYNGTIYSVKKISGNFQDNKTIKSLEFEEGIEEISGNAMAKGCTELKNVTLPEGIQITGIEAFRNCTKLEEINLPASITVIPTGTFWDCISLKNIDLGNITEIGYCGFYNCSNLAITPDLGKVKKFGDWAFAKSKICGEINLSNANVIPEKAFYYCSGIKEVKFSEHLTTIGKEAFSNCTGLQTVEFPNTLKAIEYGAFWRNTSLNGTVVIPDSVTEIGYYVFGYTSIEKFKIGSGMATIDLISLVDHNDKLALIEIDNYEQDVILSGEESNVAYKIEFLKESLDYAKCMDNGIVYIANLNPDNHTAKIIKIKTIPAGTEKIDMPAKLNYKGEEFTVTELQLKYSGNEKYSGIKELNLPNTLSNIGGQFTAFSDLESITIPGTVKKFTGILQNMKNLKTITFEEGVEQISCNNMVDQCTALTAVNLPKSLKLIDQPSTFSGASALKSIALPEDIEITNIGTFSNCSSLEEMELPASITAIEGFTFKGCHALKAVTSTGIIKEIGDSAFSSKDSSTCMNLETIPDLGQVTMIGSDAFRNCKNLEGTPDLKNVTSMGYEAFSNCNSLIGTLDLSKLEVIPAKAFYNCSKKETVEGSETVVSGIEAVKFSENLSSIGESAFEGTKISSVKFPETLKIIGKTAFYNTKTLEGVVEIPNSVEEIGDSAFASTGISEIKIGKGVASFNTNIIADCEKLTKVIIDNAEDDVTIIGTRPENVVFEFLEGSVDDTVGDTIAPGDDTTLQQAVNNAVAAGGGTITLKKHIKLSSPVTVPPAQSKGDTVKIVAEQIDGKPVIISSKKDGNFDDLFVVEAGGSIEFGENITFNGKYNRGSVIVNHGNTTLNSGVVVKNSTINSGSTGVIECSEPGSVLTLNGAVITGNKVINGVHYSGIVRVSDGGNVNIQDGSIENNIALEASYLNSTPGLLIDGNSTATMSGGTIKNNSGRRGSAVLVWGYDENPDHRATFTMDRNAKIINNECINYSTGNLASGAVHVEDNATFTMDGGSISDNTGVQGAGVCVVDRKLIYGGAWKDAAFIMNGGTISGNKASTGGGIYSYSNGVEINAGEITGNTAANLGGGIYSEGKEGHYSTLHLGNTLVRDNTATMHGGGMWYCQTGRANVYVTEGAAIFSNKANEAGDDFVFSAFTTNTDYLATLSDRMLGGGAVQWYKDGGVMLGLGGNLYASTIPNRPRYAATSNEFVEGGLTDYANCIALKAILPFNEAAELAEAKAKVVITGNTAERGGGIAANGGIVVGKPDTTKIMVTKEWKGDSESQRPEKVTVNLLNGKTIIDSVELSEKNQWKHTFDNLPIDGDYNVKEAEPAGYKSETSVKTVLVVTKKWNESNEKHPEKVKISLLNGDNNISSAELSEENQWTYVFDNLPINGDYKIEEEEITGDEGEIIVATYKHYVVTNTYIPTPPPNPPDNPDTPDQPLPPDDPLIPDEPDTPDNPDKPLPPDDPLIEEPETPSKPDEPAQTENPKTGDESNLIPWTVLLAVGAAGITGVVRVRKKKNS